MEKYLIFLILVLAGVIIKLLNDKKPRKVKTSDKKLRNVYQDTYEEDVNDIKNEFKEEKTDGLCSIGIGGPVRSGLTKSNV